MNYLKRSIEMIIFISLVGVTTIIMIQMIARHLNLTFAGGEELAVLFSVWLYFLGMALATFNEAHIQGGIEELIKNKILIYSCRVISIVVFLLFSIIGLYFSIIMLSNNIKNNYMTVVYQMPVVIYDVALIVGFVLNIIIIAWHSLEKYRINHF